MIIRLGERRLTQRRLKEPLPNVEWKAGLRVDGFVSAETGNGAGSRESASRESSFAVAENRAVSMVSVRGQVRPGCTNLQILLR